jgi:hypothetical protein
MTIVKRIGRRLKSVGRLCGPAALPAALKRRRNRLRDATQAVAALRCSLEAERSNMRAGDAVLDAYLMADRQLRGAVEEIAIPALRRCGEGDCASAREGRLRLEEALPDPVDEARIRETSWSGDGWSRSGQPRPE